MEPPDPDTLGTDLLVTMARFTRWAARNAPTAMPAAHLRALSQVDELEPVRIGDLAEADRCSQPTTSVLVRRLEERGLVVRRPDPDDSRVSRVALTAAGRDHLTDVRSAVGRDIGNALRDLEPEDRKHVAAAVQVVRRILASDHDPARAGIAG